MSHPDNQENPDTSESPGKQQIPKESGDKQPDSDSPEANLTSEKNKRPSPGMFSVLQSVLAAMFGVQSEEKRQQDFEQGHAGNYIFVGIVMLIIFILVLVKVVDAILESAGQK